MAIRAAFTVTTFLLAARVVTAAPGAYTDPAAFANAVPGGIVQADLEAFADGAPLSGVTLAPAGASAGVILPTPVTDVLDPTGPALALRVVVDAVDNPAASGTRSIGVDDAKNFDAITAGTALTFGFTAPVEAFGLTVITPEEPGAALFDGDLTLSVAGEPTATLALSDGQLLGAYGGRTYRSYFLGVVGASNFATATLDAGAAAPVSGFFYNLDDLVVPLPEPGLVEGLIGGILLLLASRRKETSP